MPEACRLKAYSHRRKCIFNFSRQFYSRRLFSLTPVTLTFAEMEAVRQRVKAAAAHKKEEERSAKGKEGVSSSTPKAVSKGLAKRKADGKDNRPLKKAAITPGDAHPKKKSPPK